MALRFSSCLQTTHCFLRALGIAVLFLGTVAPTHGAVELIGSSNPVAVADPWIITNNATLGIQQATFLDVHDGGTVDATGANFLILGDGFDSTVYVQVNVRDAGSSLSAKNLVLHPAEVTRVFIDNGGAVTVNDDFFLDSALGSINSTVAVSGSGSQLSVGDNVSLQELVVADGATALTGTSMSNTDAGDNAITTSIYDATLRGAGSTWTDHNFFQVHGTLSVEDGAHLTSTIEPTLTGSSRFRISGSGDIHLREASLTAQEISRSGAGRLHFHSGTLTLNQAGLTVGVAGLLGGAVRIDPDSTIDVSGEVVVDSGSELFIEGALVSSGLTNNGSLILRDATLDQAVTSPAGSTIDVLGNATFNGLVSGAGGVFGSGTATFNGGYNPGDSPAVVPIATDLALGAAGELSIELAGTDHGAFDQLSVAGDVSLDGTLGVALIDGFMLSPGQQFTILDIAGESTGQFAGLPEGALVGNFGGVDVSISYAAGDGNNVALFATAVPEPAAAMLLALAACASLGVRVRRQPYLGRRRSRQPGLCSVALGGLILGGLGASPCWADIQLRGSVASSATPNGVSNFQGPWNTTSLQVGHIGQEPGLLAIGGQFTSLPDIDTVEVGDDIAVGVQVPGTLFVAGTNSLLTSGGAIRVGQGARGLLLATGGATIETGDAEIGGDAEVGTGSVDISGSGTTWDHYDLDINAEGDLGVSNGAAVETENLATIGGRIAVGGPGSVWTTGALNMSGSAASIVISDGAQVNVRGEFFLDFPGLEEPIFRDDFGVRLSSGSIVIQGGTLSTNFFGPFTPGRLDFDHGTLSLSDSGLVVGASGLLGDAVQIDSGSAINLSDDVTVEAGATLTVAGTLSSASLNNNGVLTLIDTSLDQAVVSPAGSTIDLIGDVTFNGLVSGAANIFGSGTPTFNGGYSPGDSPATVIIENDLALGAGNTLSIELAGLIDGEFDSLQVGGDVMLDGLLDVQLAEGFEFEPNQEFEILDVAGELTGQFQNLGEGGLVGMFDDWLLYISYAGGDGNDVALYSTPSVTGDFNADGAVDGADFLAWQRSPGDGELADWKTNFGQPSATSTVVTVVPEPSTLLLLLATCLIAASKRRRFNAKPRIPVEALVVLTAAFQAVAASSARADLILAPGDVVHLESDNYTESISNNGVLHLPSTSTTFAGHVGGAGGYVGDAAFIGTFSPGNSPAVVGFENNFALGGLGTLNIELAGTVLGEFDRLEIGGNATLAGMLNIELLAPFTVSAGQTFEIIDVVGTRTGMFQGLDEGAVAATFDSIDLKISYLGGNGNDVVLTAVPEAGWLGGVGVILTCWVCSLRKTSVHGTPTC